jgi:hypothetical protein
MARQSGFNTAFPAQSAKQLPVALQQYLQNLGIVVTDLTEFGGTADRPTTGLYVGEPFFDTDLQQVVNWNGTSWANTASIALNRANTIAILADGVVIQPNTSNSNYQTSPSVNVSVVADGTDQTNISFTVNTAAIGSVAGAQGDIQFNSNGVFGADPHLAYNVATQTLSVPTMAADTGEFSANVTALELTVSQNVSANEIQTSSLIVAGGNTLIGGPLFATFNNGSVGLPVHTTQPGQAIVWNITNGAGEADFINTFFAASTSFEWFQITSANNLSTLMSLSSTGTLTVNGLTVTGAFSLPNTSLTVSGLTVNGDTNLNGPVVVNTTTALSLTLNGAIACGAGASFAGPVLFSNNAGSFAPPTTSILGGFVFSNLSNGAGEVDFFNSFFTASKSFEWFQHTAANNVSTLMSLSPAGGLTVKGLTVNGSIAANFIQLGASGMQATVPAATQVNALTLNQGSQPAWILFQPASNTDFNLFNGTFGTHTQFHQSGGMTLNGPFGINFPGGASFNPIAGGSIDGGYITWNITNADGEIDFINSFESSPGISFEWFQQTSVPSLVSLMHLTSAGALTVVSLTQTSDANLKSNVTTIANATNLILGMDGVTFNWVSDGTPSAGLIAQNVANVMPELVATDRNGTMSLNYSGVVGALVAAFKEQQAVITQLQADIAALQSLSVANTSANQSS